MTTFSDRSKNFKNVRRQFFKHKKENDTQFTNKKFKHENKKKK